MTDINTLTPAQQKLILELGYEPSDDPAPEPYRVFGYIRVSTTKQKNKGEGEKDQEAEILAYCANPPTQKPNIVAEPLTITRWYRDLAISGKSMDRPEFNMMKKVVDKSDTIIVRDLSRISRNTEEFLTFFGEMKRRGVKLVILNISYDLNTPMGVAALQIGAVFAELERSQANERTSRIMQAMNASGKALGRVPFGYHKEKKVTKEKPEGESILVEDEKEMEVVLKIGRIMKANKGISYAKIAEILNNEGVKIRNSKQCWPSTIDLIIKRHGLNVLRGPIIGVIAPPKVESTEPAVSSLAAAAAALTIAPPK